MTLQQIVACMVVQCQAVYHHRHEVAPSVLQCMVLSLISQHLHVTQPSCLLLMQLCQEHIEHSYAETYISTCIVITVTPYTAVNSSLHIMGVLNLKGTGGL